MRVTHGFFFPYKRMNFNNWWIPTSNVIKGKKRMLKLDTFKKEDVILLGTYYKGKSHKMG